MRQPSTASAPYWGMLRSLSKPVKLELVALLSESLAFEDEFKKTVMSDKEKDKLFESLCGCWASNPEDASRMENAVKSCRENDELREVNIFK